jgi:hypothetical protein
MAFRACPMMRRWKGMPDGAGDGCELAQHHPGDHQFPPPRLCPTVFAGTEGVPARRCGLPPGHRSPCRDLVGAATRGHPLSVCSSCDGYGGQLHAAQETRAWMPPPRQNFHVCAVCDGQGVLAGSGG